MKLKFKGENVFEGRTYDIAPDCTIVEVFVCTTGRETYQYFVKHPENDVTLLFSFGIPLDLSQPRDQQRFSRDQLEELYCDGYFDAEVKKLKEECYEL